MTLTFMVLSVMFMFLLGSSDVNIESQNYVTVTSSGNLTDGSNFFADPAISTNFNLPNCVSPSIGGTTIAYVAPQSSSAYYFEEMAAIDGINAVIVDAYRLNNPESPQMAIQAFVNENDLNSFV